MTKKIEVLAREVRLTGVNDQDYVCLTDVARYKNVERTDYFISNWLRNRNTNEFHGIWKQINNPDFNPIEFDGIKKRLRPQPIHHPTDEPAHRGQSPTNTVEENELNMSAHLEFCMLDAPRAKVLESIEGMMV